MIRLTLKQTFHHVTGDVMQASKLSNAHAYLSKLLAKLLCLLVGQMGIAVAFTRHMTRLSAAFRDHVCCVVFRCAKKQMGGIHTTPIVAFVKNPKTLWDRVTVKFMGNNVRSNYASVHKELAVTRAIYCSLPLPTFIRAAFVHLLPKAFREGATKRRLGTCVVALKEAARLSLNVATTRIGGLGDEGGLTTTALTQPGWVLWRQVARCASVVKLNVSIRFALYLTDARAIPGANLRLLPASALAITVRDFLCVHRCNYSTFYTYLDWQKADSCGVLEMEYA